MMITYYNYGDTISVDGACFIPEGSERYDAIISKVDAGDAEIVPYQLPDPSAIEVRNAKLASLVHKFKDGRVIQCRPSPYPDESNMRNAIEQMERRGEESRGWYAADNTWIEVTSKELREAIESGQDQSDVVWNEFAVNVTN